MPKEMGGWRLAQFARLPHVAEAAAAELCVRRRPRQPIMSIPTSTQIGAIAENFVSTVLMIESRGRLATFHPVADDDGIDLLVYDKHTGRALPIQVKSRLVTLKSRASKGTSDERGSIAHFQLRHSTFKSDRYGAAILILSDEDGYDLRCAWVMSMDDISTVARKSKDKYVIRASIQPASNDRYTKYRCQSRAELYKCVMQMLATTPAAPAPVGVV